jgi:hypothetical protein
MSFHKDYLFVKRRYIFYKIIKIFEKLAQITERALFKFFFSRTISVLCEQKAVS